MAGRCAIPSANSTRSFPPTPPPYHARALGHRCVPSCVRLCACARRALAGSVDPVHRLGLGVPALGDGIALVAQARQSGAGGVREPAGHLDHAARRAGLALSLARLGGFLAPALRLRRGLLLALAVVADANRVSSPIRLPSSSVNQCG